MNIIIIGSSSGGPAVLYKIFDGLAALNSAIVVVQHMPKFINASLADRLDRNSGMQVRLAKNGDRLAEGQTLIAPSLLHLELDDNRLVKLTSSEKVHSVRPAIDKTMLSLKKGPDLLVGVILSGMGADGAAGISHIKNCGGVTISQDEETCAVSGMPKAAVATGHVDFTLSPDEIQGKLLELSRTPG